MRKKTAITISLLTIFMLVFTGSQVASGGVKPGIIDNTSAKQAVQPAESPGILLTNNTKNSGGRNSATVTIPVLMYHEIGDGPNSLYVSEQSFQEQMAYLYEHDYVVLTLAHAAEMMQKHQKVSRVVALTFDDGYESFYTRAWPVLQKYGFTATVYVITGLTGRPGYLSWDEIRSLAASGGVEIGSHTRTHPSLKAIRPDRLKEELEGAGQDIRNNTGVEVKTFCYPSGAYSQAVVDKVKQMGYIAAVTTVYGKATSSSNPYLLPRVRVSRGLTLNEFINRIE